jgi:dipeptidyl aminopeptidase/acylaminoacyl peptidase
MPTLVFSLPLILCLKNIKITLSALLLSISVSGCSGDKGVPVKEIVRFESDGVFLEGALDLPGGSGKHPLVVFVHGSGSATRNDYEEFVVPLLKEGIAVFRYDKRGIGASGGKYSDVGPENSERVFTLLASDAAAAIRYLKNHQRIAGNKIILIGGSQAGWIIPEINTPTDVWLSVCISGPSVTVGEEIYYSDRAENGSYSQEQADQMLKDFQGFHGYDPISRIEKMQAPSLWVFGGKDVSIPVKRSIHLLDSIKESHHLLLEIKLYPGADHGLFNASTKKREDHVHWIIEWIRRHH